MRIERAPKRHTNEAASKLREWSVEHKCTTTLCRNRSVLYALNCLVKQFGVNSEIKTWARKKGCETLGGMWPAIHCEAGIVDHRPMEAAIQDLQNCGLITVTRAKKVAIKVHWKA